MSKARLSLIGIIGSIVCMLSIVACGGGETRPGAVSVDPKSETVSISVSGTHSGSYSASASGTHSGSTSASGSASNSGSASSSGTHSGDSESEPGVGSAEMGGYAPASDVATHALVVLDVQEINELLGAETIDFSAVKAIYEDGKNSVKSSGSVRTIAGYARNADRSEAIWDDYVAHYGDPTWLDSYVSAALDGTGAFEGESDGVRKQGVQKGIQNQIMISWSIHELVAAMAKASDGNFDAAKGAPHNWDEAWAFYHGDAPSSGPFGTANKRGGNFGTGTSVNDTILAEMIVGRDALVAGDAETAQAAADEIIRQIHITYVQASIRYASKMGSDLAGGDTDKARVHQAEGLSFYMVIEPMVAAADASAAATISSVYDLSNEAADPGSSVLEALESVYSALGISADEVGSLS